MHARAYVAWNEWVTPSDIGCPISGYSNFWSLGRRTSSPYAQETYGTSQEGECGYSSWTNALSYPVLHVSTIVSAFCLLLIA